MWIRSQKRNMLADIKFMCMCNESDGWVIYCESPGGVTDRLGVYSTEEKALKVLDEIQTCIMTEHHYHTDDANCTRRFFTKEWKEIYQMPQDEEVEV